MAEIKCYTDLKMVKGRMEMMPVRLYVDNEWYPLTTKDSDTSLFLDNSCVKDILGYGCPVKFLCHADSAHSK